MPSRASAVVISLHSDRPIDLDNVEEAITLCATEIRKSKLDWNTIADRAGLCRKTISNIAYEDVRRPHMNTVLRILKVFGYRIYAQRGA